MGRVVVIERKAIELARSRSGWSWLYNASKWHYFGDDGRSICGRWMTLGGTPADADQDDDGRENCGTCRKRVAKLREQQRALLATVAANEGRAIVDAPPAPAKGSPVDLARKVLEVGRLDAETDELLRSVLIAYDKRGAAVADAIEAIRVLLETGATGSEVRLLAVGTNGKAMADKTSETGQAIHARCDGIDAARARALEVLGALRAS